MQNETSIENISQQYADESLLDTLVFMNNTAFGYSSMQAYALFYPIPFMILLNNFFLPSSLVTITRQTSRDTLYIKRVMNIVVVAIMFSLLHSGVNFLLTNFFLDISSLEDTNFLVVCFFNSIGLSLFYTGVGLLYKLIEDSSNSLGIAFFLTMLLIGGQFFIGKLFFAQSWIPMRDLVLYTTLLEKQWDVMDVLFVYGRQCLLVIFFYLIGSFTFNRKDFKS